MTKVNLWHKVRVDVDPKGNLVVDSLHAPFDGNPVLINTSLGMVEAIWEPASFYFGPEGQEADGFCFATSQTHFEWEEVHDWMPIPHGAWQAHIPQDENPRLIHSLDHGWIEAWYDHKDQVWQALDASIQIQENPIWQDLPERPPLFQRGDYIRYTDSMGFAHDGIVMEADHEKAQIRHVYPGGRLISAGDVTFYVGKDTINQHVPNAVSAESLQRLSNTMIREETRQQHEKQVIQELKSYLNLQNAPVLDKELVDFLKRWVIDPQQATMHDIVMQNPDKTAQWAEKLREDKHDYAQAVGRDNVEGDWMIGAATLLEELVKREPQKITDKQDQKAQGHEESVKYVVQNEHTLGYVLPKQENASAMLGILQGDVLNGGPDRMQGMVLLEPENIRPATAQDFEKFRVQIPQDFPLLPSQAPLMARIIDHHDTPRYVSVSLDAQGHITGNLTWGGKNIALDFSENSLLSLGALNGRGGAYLVNIARAEGSEAGKNSPVDVRVFQKSEDGKLQQIHSKPGRLMAESSTKNSVSVTVSQALGVHPDAFSETVTPSPALRMR